MLVITRASLVELGHATDASPLFCVYIRDADGREIGIRVTSLGNLANMIQTLSPSRVEFVCAENEDEASLRHEIGFLLANRGSVH